MAEAPFRRAHIPGRRAPARRSGFTNIELLVVIAIIAILIGMLLPAIQKVREAENSDRADEECRRLALEVGAFFDAQGRLPTGLGEMSGLVDESLALGRKGGFKFSLEPVSATRLRIHCWPSSLGVTGDREATTEVTVSPLTFTEPEWTPVSGATAAREAMLASVYAAGIRSAVDVLAQDQTGQTGAAAASYLCDPANTMQAFQNLDIDGDGKVTLSEVSTLGQSRRFPALAPFLNETRSLMQLGVDDEDITLHPGAGLVEGETICSVQVFPVFHRGDANASGVVDISDGVAIFSALFLSLDTVPPCLEAANANDDDKLDISDGVFVLNFLFVSGVEPPSPGPPPNACGEDPPGPPETLGCVRYDACGP